MHVGLELGVAGGRRGGAVAWRRAEPVLGPTAEALHVPRQSAARAISPATPSVKRSASGTVIAKSSARNVDVSAARIAATDRALPASVPPMPLTSTDGAVRSAPQAPAQLGRQPVCAGRQAAADRLADHQHVGVEPHARGAPARPGADGVGLVEHEQGAGAAGELAHGVEETRLGQHDADVGERRLGEHARDVARRQRRGERVGVVERHDRARRCRIGGRAEGTGTRHHATGGVERDERLVDGAVVAPVEHGDAAAAGHVAGQAQGDAVGVGGADGELPQRQAEAGRQLAGHPGGILGRQHRRRAGAGPSRHRRGHLRHGVPTHRRGVAEAQVDVRHGRRRRRAGHRRRGRRTAGRRRANGSSTPSARRRAGARRSARPTPPTPGGRRRSGDARRRGRRAAVPGRRSPRSPVRHRAARRGPKPATRAAPARPRRASTAGGPPAVPGASPRPPRTTGPSSRRPDR